MADGLALMGLGASGLRDRLASGALRATDLAEACIARIEARDPEVRAFAFFDAGFVRHQAQALDEVKRRGKPLGRLHGLPVALKDIIDTARIPTENGSAVDKGRVPGKDAWVVQRLKAEGAIIVGKTVTTELAFMDAGPTRNPHGLDHTPGGSSSGSAAAVADGMVPLAIGTQTGGSVIRPASFCGVAGFKPSFGAIPRSGILMQSHTLDTPGVFASDVAGAALLADVLFGHDAGDSATAPAPPPRLFETAEADPPLPPVFAVIQPPGWEQADDDMKDAMRELREALGEQAFPVPLPNAFDEAATQRRLINFAEMARYYYRYGKDGGAGLGPEVRGAIDEGGRILARDYLAALDWRTVLNAGLDEIFGRCDAILCPSALGPAPKGLDFTGDPIFNGLWTFCGTPAINVPLLTASNGLPMGVQIIGARGNDARLLRSARWLESWAGGSTERT